MSGPVDTSGGFALALETSGAVGGAAVGYGADVLGVRRLAGDRPHAVDLLPTIDELCRSCGVRPGELCRVYVSCGPGSFTGLRIGITVARMLAFGGGAEIIPVPTLEVIAQNALDVVPRPERVAVLLDAKRSRVYAAAFAFEQDRYVPLCAPVEADSVLFLRSWSAVNDGGRQAGHGSASSAGPAVLGEGVVRYRAAIEPSGWGVLPNETYAPRAERVYRLGVRLAAAGSRVDPRRVVPTYVRLPEAEEKWQQRHGR